MRVDPVQTIRSNTCPTREANADGKERPRGGRSDAIYFRGDRRRRFRSFEGFSENTKVSRAGTYRCRGLSVRSRATLHGSGKDRCFGYFLYFYAEILSFERDPNRVYYEMKENACSWLWLTRRKKIFSQSKIIRIAIPRAADNMRRQRRYGRKIIYYILL